MEKILQEIIKEAGKISLNFFDHGQKINDDFMVVKQDQSPVTLADIEVDRFIKKSIRNISPFPIVTEESENDENLGDSFWLVDPIDGTKSFIKGSVEFTVNIALINKGRPVIGLIYQPCEDLLYFTENGKSFKDHAGKVEQIEASDKIKDAVFIFGRSVNRKSTNIQMSSSLKFGKIAEKIADVYYMNRQIMEWDVAAGQAILEQANGLVMDKNFLPIRYGACYGFKKFMLPSFIAAANKSLYSDNLHKI